MTKEIIHPDSATPKLSLYASNEREVDFLKELYTLLNDNNIACNYDNGNFHYGLIIRLVKDEYEII